MDYNEMQHMMRSARMSNAAAKPFSGSSLSITERDFISARRELFSIDQSDSFYNISDGQIPENDHFTYPVFKHSDRSGGVIVLLHGLNERDWDKYLSWAFVLAEKTGKDVILFPISFHMGRSPKEWINPRSLMEKLESRKQKFSDVKMASFANLALSERLTTHPERFMLSGYQSAMDIMKLITDIKSGNDPLFHPETSIDFFSYSIGAFLSQILFLTNPNGIFDASKLFMFCGGSVFNRMDGVSKYIMDSVAFDRVINYYGEAIDENRSENKTVRQILKDTQLGESFYSMTSLDRLNRIKKDVFSRIKDQIQVLGLLKDKVIPADSIKRTLKGCRVSFLNPDYHYSHENPFPVVNNEFSGRINKTFHIIMDQAAGFLS
ncbi:DUF6051 family protein [Saccharicrinis sp. FJH54]|uniref:DUF6051 family protein n=1 Tax=Saccharicrinis sp. FJH54 TaxID=3344665 RepID=UPI0035D49E96